MQSQILAILGEDDSYDNALAETINGLYKAERRWRSSPTGPISGGVIEIGTPRWVMPKQVARAMKLQRGQKLRWPVQGDGSVRVEKV